MNEHEHEHDCEHETQPKPVLWVCGNEETVLDGTYFSNPYCGLFDGAAAASAAHAAACRVIDDSGIAEARNSPYFHDWHGGRFYDHRYCAGWIFYGREASPDIVALAWAAEAAWAAEFADWVALAQREDRKRILAAIEDENENEVEDLATLAELLPEADFALHTRASIASALRENNPKLLAWREEEEAAG